MAIQQFDRYAKLPEDNYVVRTKRFYNESYSSRSNGKLTLKPQYHEFQDCELVSISRNPVPYQNELRAFTPVHANWFGGEFRPPGFNWKTTDNKANARFVAEVRKGSASLGVTFGSWRQSREMIVHRAQQSAKLMDQAYASLIGDKKRLRRIRRQREPAANLVLEGQFGWVPLQQDIHASLNTVCQEALDVPRFVSGRGRASWNVSEYDDGSNPATSPHQNIQWNGSSRTTVNALVRVSNPNAYLLNRLGLVNPALVAWDLVPWSFVVNMFVNTNQLISSVTDFVGLELSDMSTTQSATMSRTEMQFGNLVTIDGRKVQFPGSCLTEHRNRYKYRTVGGFPPVVPEFKVPKLDWNLAVIASSLLLQKASRISNLIRF